MDHSNALRKLADDAGFGNQFVKQAVETLRGAADEIDGLRKMLRDQFEGWHDPDCKVWRESVKLCTCGHDEVKAALAGTAHQF
jgi:hypothetical protein